MNFLILLCLGKPTFRQAPSGLESLQCEIMGKRHYTEELLCQPLPEETDCSRAHGWT